MSITNKTITSPRIFLTGTRVNDDGSHTVLTMHDAESIIEQTDSHEYTHQPTVVFAGSVTITMTSVYALKGYSGETDSLNHRIGSLEDSHNKNKAEIRYTVNGKDPSRTSFKRYGSPITLTTNKSGTDNTVIKAKVYRQGYISEATSVIVKVR